MKIDYTDNCADLYPDTDLTSHMEDYLETIAILAERNRVVRVKDIAAEMKIKMPSVTAALNKLRDKGLIDYEKYGYIDLTEKGIEVAKSVYCRHSCLYDFFHEVLGLISLDADKEACKVEHNLTPGTFKKFHLFMRFIRKEIKAGEPWVERLKKALNTTRGK